MKSEIKEFIAQVTREVRFKEAHAEIAHELNGHVQDLMENEGLDSSRALARLGDPSEIGAKLNKVHRDDWNWSLIAMTVSWFAIGVIAMSLVGRTNAQFLYGFIGLSLATWLAWLRPLSLRRSSLWIYLGAVAFVVYGFLFGARQEGLAYLWLGPFRVNVLGFMFVPMLLALAGLVERLRSSSALLILALMPVTALVAVHSFYMSLVFALCVLAMMIVGRVSVWCWGVFALLALGMWIAGFSATDFIFGPMVESEAHTDFVIGLLRSRAWILAPLVLGIGAVMTVQLSVMTFRLRSPFGRCVSVGAAVYFAVGLLYGVLAGLGLVGMPVGGVVVPFVSYGGSMMIGAFALVGVVVGSWRRKSFN